jgi:signal transduction histidine kinase
LKIRSLLSLSHAAVIAVFIVTFLVIFFYLTRPPRVLGEPHVVEELTQILKENSDSQVPTEKLEQMDFTEDSELDLFDRDGNHRRLLGGPATLEAPTFLPEILKGRLIGERDFRLRRHVEWIAIDLDGPRSHVIRLSAPGGREQFFAQVRANVVLACTISFLAVLVVVLLLSRALAEPIGRLAGFVERFGREGYELRSDVEGPKELQELSSSINRMAAFIEKNTTELKEQKEIAERTEALRREFLSDVSHNLRTPLTAILGWNDALIDGVAEDEAAYRQRIRREVLRVNKIVQRLLELSRWERAKPVLVWEPVPLAELLLEVAENLEESAEAAGVTLEFEGLKSDTLIQADRQKARDIFQILLENVVAHAGQGVHATVCVETTETLVKLVIRDDGAGFPDTFSGETDMERGASEVGRACLGLAIASRLVKAHGQKLTLSNRPEGGAVAEFSFPRDGAEG